MDLNHLRQLLDLVREHGLSEIEIEHDGLRVKVRKDGAAATGAVLSAAAAPPAVGPMLPVGVSAPTLSPGASSAGPKGPEADAVDSEIELAVVKSPIVGTFYRSAEPGSSSFVEVGTSVKKGQVLCIIEAMKLMNEIDSEYDGDIVNVYVENGQPVQYGERLFAIRTR